MRRLLAVCATAAMTVTAVGCTQSGGSTTGTDSGSTTTADGGSVAAPVSGYAHYDSTGARNLLLGTWWYVNYYDSAQLASGDMSKLPDGTEMVDYTNALPQDGDDDSMKAQRETNMTVCQDKWANAQNIESTYGIKYYWTNLTYEGVQSSINTSILAGTPDCDLYLIDAGMGIPAQANGLAVDLRTVLPADADIFNDQQVMSYLDMGDGKVCMIQRVEAQHQVEATYPLGFNKQMLDAAGLEDPRDLWDRGEWTWDKFNEYCQVLTQDTDGDGQIDQYGYCGYENETMEQLMMSNGANIAAGTTQTLDSPAMGEVLQEIYDLYNNYNVCYPYDFDGTPSDSMRNQYTNGNIAFFPIAAWIASGNGDYDHSAAAPQVTFDTCYVRWPVGPSGNKDTNAGKNDTSGELYMIPAGIDDPALVYNFLYDLWNWGGTPEETAVLRDDKQVMNWWYSVTAWEEDLQDQNFSCMNDCGAHTTFDLWNAMGVEYDLQGVIRGEMTPAQFQETYKQSFQDGLDAYFN